MQQIERPYDNEGIIISEGTLKTEDLATTFLGVLNHYYPEWLQEQLNDPVIEVITMLLIHDGWYGVQFILDGAKIPTGKYGNPTRLYDQADVNQRYIDGWSRMLDLEHSPNRVTDYLNEQFSMWLNEDIYAAMEEIAPEGYYFGSSEGDGACIGYWPIEEECDDEEENDDGYNN